MLSEILGMKIVLSEHACEPEYELVRRTWKERLFSMPWEPRRKYKQVLKSLNPYIARVGNIIVAHTSLEGQIRHLATIASDTANAPARKSNC